MPSTNDPWVLSLDCGTQSVRALIFDIKGTLVAKTKIALQPYFSDKPDWAEQDPEYFWRQLCEACNQLWKLQPSAKANLIGVTLTTQRNTVIHVDKDGEPLRPAIVWLDKRKTENLPSLGIIRYLFKAMGLNEVIHNYRTNAESNWVSQHQPEIWENTHKQLLLSGYLNFKLCGKFIDSAASQVGYLPFNYKKKVWASSWDWKWSLQALTKEKLPEIVPACSIMGTITKDAAEQTGIPDGLPLVAAAGDKACETLGSGCIHPPQGSISYGTSATFNVCSTKYVELFGYFPPYPAAFPEGYNNEYQINRGYMLIKWFIDEFGAEEIQQAYQRKMSVESVLDEKIKNIPPGNEGLILQPYWSSSFSIKEANAKGAIIGFKDNHKKEHIYKAIIEGNAYSLKEGMEIVQKATGVPVTDLRVSGGGSQSDIVMQITADIFGLPVWRLHTHEATGLGAAICTVVALHQYKWIEDAVKGMVHLGKKFEPDPKAQKIYKELYESVFKAMLPQLQPLYKQIDVILSI